MGRKLIGITNGCFDPVHIGHIYFFANCKLYVEKLIVALNSDESVKRLKGDNKPVYSIDERKYFLNNIKSVDAIHVFDTEQGLVELIHRIKPRYLFKGNEYIGKPITGLNELLRHGGEMMFIKPYSDWSSTKLVNMGNSNEENSCHWRGSN